MLDPSLSKQLVTQILWDSGKQDKKTIESWDILLNCMIHDLNRTLENFGSFREKIAGMVRNPPSGPDDWKFMTDAMITTINETYGPNHFMMSIVDEVLSQARLSWHGLIITDKMFRLGVWYVLTLGTKRRMK